MKSILSFGGPVLAACVSLFSVVSAQASPRADERITVHAGVTAMSVSRDVNYSDLDLTKPEDVARLKSRTNRAAVQVCIELYDRNPWAISSLFGARAPCVRNAQQQALAQVPGVVVPSRYRFAGEVD
jgi:UrcA family protein